ncbi:MAG TPA: hypothetical protein VGL92_11770 [Acidimicrobiia bacterium]
MIDDVLEPSVPTPTSRPRRVKISVAAVALVAVLAGGLAVALSGENEPEPLALVAGAQGDARAEGAAAPAIAPMAAADSKMSLGAPGYWGGIEYQVEGKLPDLGDKAVAWRVVTPDLDRETVARWSAALGLPGTPQLRDGSWVVESPEANFNAYPADGWSISYNRMPGDRSSGAVSAGEAERQARDLLDRLGVLEGEWRVQVFETEIGVGYACAEAVKVKEEMARLEPDTAVSSEPPSMPSMPSMPDCPPPPPPVKGQNVSFFPVVGGMRTDWSVWNVTVGPEGIENLYGNWATFERGDEYKLRSVDAALEELRQGGRAIPMPAPMPPMPVDDIMPVEPAIDPATATTVVGGSSAGGASGSAGAASGSAGIATPTTVAVDYAEPAMGMPAPTSAPAIDMAPRPTIAPYTYPCPPEADCVAPEPQVVTITGVELTLLPNPVYSGRTAPARMYLVPAYRFTGTFQGGEAWETSVIALHPDAIAPPPPVDGEFPVKGTESTTLPMPAPPYSTGMTTAPEKPPAG